MCRLLGCLSFDPIQSLYVLRDSEQSLFRQSYADKKRLQGDGWGIGWLESKRGRVVKSPRPLYREKSRLSAAALRVRGSCLIGHVRWASNPLKLPKTQLIGKVHTQPFQFKNWLFAHNGTLYIPREVKAHIGDWAQFLKGRNDSEVLFYWLMKDLWPLLKGESQSLRELGMAVRRSVQGLNRIWASCRKKYPIYRYAYHGLNWVLTNGQVMLAFCYVDPKGFDSATALCSKGQSYYQVQFQASPKTTVFASEPLYGKGDWLPMRHGELILAQLMPRGIKNDRLKVF